MKKNLKKDRHHLKIALCSKRQKKNIEKREKKNKKNKEKSNNNNKYRFTFTFTFFIYKKYILSEIYLGNMFMLHFYGRLFTW